MKLHVRHLTRYGYTHAASLSHNHVCLQPRDTSNQRCLNSRVEVNPEPDSIQYERDAYGNASARFNLSQRHKACEIIVTSLVETNDHHPPLPTSHEVTANRRMMDSCDSAEALMAHDCLLPSPYIPVNETIVQFIKEIPLGNTSVLEHAHRMMHHVYSTFAYESGFSSLATPLEQIYDARKGVCQDFAHLAIAALRLQGIPARYVSGYLETLPPPGQQKLQGADASHAWFSVYDAQHGWFDFDPTNNKRPDAQYITTAWGRDFGDVTPVKGVVYGGGKHSLTVEVDVTRIAESRLSIKEP